VIDDVQVCRNENGGVRAYVHAASTASAEQLLEIKNGLADRNLKVIPTTKDGRPVLEVRGFKKPSDFTRILLEKHYITGVSSMTREEGDIVNPAQKWRHATLSAAGLSYNIGDIAYLTYAFKKYHHEHVPNAKNMTNFFNVMDIVAGFGYAAGSLALTKYGHGDRSQIMIQSTNKKIKDYLADTGINVPEDSALANSTHEKKRGFFGRLDNVFARYPSETFNSIYIFVGALLGSAAFYRAVVAHTKGNLKEARAEAMDVGLGLMTFTSAMTGLLVKEKRIDENDRRQGLGKVLDWVQEKPLRATGFGYMISTLFHGYGTYVKHKGGDALVKKTAVYRGIFVLANVVSEVMLFVSSKGHGEGLKPDKSVDESILASTAELILRQPPERQKTLTSQLAGYLAAPEVMGGDVDKMAHTLQAHMDALQKNPWTSAKTRSPQEPAQAAVSQQVAPTHAHELPSATISHAQHLQRVQATPALSHTA
jgi:hypothetical protein